MEKLRWLENTSSMNTWGRGDKHFCRIRAEYGQKDGESRVLDILHTRREQRQVCDERRVIFFFFSGEV